ncbi:MAG: hypothetical protein WC933_01775 [Candidatus Paceibacterota bacterium]|jgi:hypothetical protein
MKKIINKYLIKFIPIIKKTSRTLLIILITFILIGLSIWGINEIYVFQTITKQKNSIDISIKVSDSCEQNFPISVTIINNSNRVIKNISIYPEARREGYSKNLAGYNSKIETDKIIIPNNGYKVCWKGVLDYGVDKTYKPENLKWSVGSFNVEFE